MTDPGVAIPLGCLAFEYTLVCMNTCSRQASCCYALTSMCFLNGVRTIKHSYDAVCAAVLHVIAFQDFV